MQALCASSLLSSCNPPSFTFALRRSDEAYSHMQALCASSLCPLRKPFRLSSCKPPSVHLPVFYQMYDALALTARVYSNLSWQQPSFQNLNAARNACKELISNNFAQVSRSPHSSLHRGVVVCRCTCTGAHEQRYGCTRSGQFASIPACRWDAKRSRNMFTAGTGRPDALTPLLPK